MGRREPRYEGSGGERLAREIDTNVQGFTQVRAARGVTPYSCLSVGLIGPERLQAAVATTS